MKTTAKLVREIAAQLTKNRSDRETIEAKLRTPQDIVQRFHDRMEEIARDLMPEAREKAAKSAGRDALAELQKWHMSTDEPLAKHDESIRDRMRAAVAPKPRSTDWAERVERALLRQEIRAAALGLDELGREQLYRSLSPDLREALTEIPAIVKRGNFAAVEPFVPGQLVEECLLEAGAKALPEEAAMLETIREHREILQLVRNQVEKSIKDVVEIPREEAVAQ